jgi:uncharacterized protein DUF3883
MESGGGRESTGSDARHGPGTETRAGALSSGTSSGARHDSPKRTSAGAGGRPFISYVGVRPDEEDPSLDALDHQARMALEEKAITFILKSEPQLQRTPPFNEGYDLFEYGDDGKPARWIEVKAMSSSLHDRPVGLSRPQFECAREHGEAYWLYVVEHADDDGGRRIVRIQDPACKARTFTFDHGWLDVANVNAGNEPAS